MNKRLNIRTAFVLVMAMFITKLSAQSNLTLYHMESLPQRTYVNPAQVPDSRLFFGFPGLSSVDLSLNSNVLNLRRINDAFVPVSGTDSFQLDVNRLSAVFDQDMYLNTTMNVDLMHLGFKFGEGYWTFNITEKMKSRVVLPKDLFQLILEGNGGENLGRTFRFNLAADLLHTREYALGYSRSLLDNRLRVGARAKYLYGLNVIETERNDLQFVTQKEDFSYLVSGDVRVNASSSMVSLDSAMEFDLNRFLFGTENSGFGLDLGIELEVNDRMTVSASVVDLGQIWWTDNVQNYHSSNPKKQFEFKGVDIKRIWQDSGDFNEELELMLDSLTAVLDMDSSEMSFSTGLFSEFYLGGKFELNQNHNVAVLFYGSYYDRKLYPAMTVSWNARFKKVLGLSMSYSMMHGNFTNFGMGYSLNLGSFQAYMVSDNLIGISAGNIKNISMRFGINFTFGRRESDL